MCVRDVIMTLDVIEIDGLGNAWVLIQVHQITLQIWVIDNAPQIALEMPVIDDVEPDERAEKSPIGFHDPVVEKKTALRQAFLQLIERLKEFSAGDFIWSLTRGETGSVNAVVHIVVQKTAEVRVLGFDFFREKIDVLVFGKVIKDVVKHSADIVLRIVHYLFGLLVPQDRHSDAGAIIRIGRLIGFTQEMEAVDRIG